MRNLKKTNKTVVSAACVYIIFLLLEFLIYKSILITYHDMGDIPKLLLITGIIIILIASCYTSQIVPASTILGYGLGFFVGVNCNIHTIDYGRTLHDQSWVVWCAVFLACIAVGMLIELYLHKGCKKRILLSILLCILIMDGILWYDLFFPASVYPFSNLEPYDIKRIYQTGSTGGKNGDFKNDLNTEQIEQFIDLLKKVKLGKEISRNQALSYGAVTYYTITPQKGVSFTISPGKYFLFKEHYFQFINYEELKNDFISINSN